jgi:hypothetical protein
MRKGYETECNAKGILTGKAFFTSLGNHCNG